MILVYRFKLAVVGATDFGYFAVAFIVLLVMCRVVSMKLNSMLGYEDKIKSEVNSMKIKNEMVNVLVGSLDVAGAIGANVLVSCLLA